jgi:hypothetical protein
MNPFGPDTHGAFIELPDGSRAFIDGIPDKCEHQWDGPGLSFNDAGEYFKNSDMPDYHSDPDGWYKFQEDHKIRGGCVSCSKCGKPFEPPMF